MKRDPARLPVPKVVLPPIKRPATSPLEQGAEKKTPPAVSSDCHIQAPILRQYYRMLCPLNFLFQWLSYGKPTFGNREFSFTLRDNIYVRHNMFAGEDDLRNALTTKTPVKFDIGATFSAPASHRAILQTAYTPVSRELVFDIDLSDYDEVRRCCSGPAACQKCWRFAAAAVGVLDHLLRAWLGFTTLLWVYSGRRGVHCWVCDCRARQLTAKERAAIVEFIRICPVKAGKMGSASQPMHPSTAAVYQTVIEPAWLPMLEEQGLLGSGPSTWDPILRWLDPRNAELLRFKWKGAQTTRQEKWAQVEAALSRQRGDKSGAADLVCHYLYPRLDEKVTTGLNHLLKSPFSVHPNTGKICVPFDPDKAAEFTIDDVPTVRELLAELDEYKGDPSVPLIQRTSLGPVVEQCMTLFAAD